MRLGLARLTAALAGLGVVFLVEPVEEPLAQRQYLNLYVATGQVRFVKKSEPRDLVEVSPIIFSELMRDVDLFVSVAIATDPDYGTRPTAPPATYWAQAALGPLTETAKTRHAVLQDLLPGLSIADRCRLEERFMIVRGTLRTYRIHLGSANIRMEPHNQNLCIVQDRLEFGDRLRLPFEGDSTLSTILSKAFLLADDDKITDPTILSQIKRR